MFDFEEIHSLVNTMSIYSPPVVKTLDIVMLGVFCVVLKYDLSI